MSLVVICQEPAQAHRAIKESVWPHVRAETEQGRAMVVKVEPWEDDRTLRQNRFYWGVVLRAIAAQATVDGIGADDEGWNWHWKKRFLGYRVEKVRVPGKKRPTVRRVLISTKDLKVRAMAEYLEKVMAEAATVFGVRFPALMWEEYQGQKIDPETGEILC